MPSKFNKNVCLVIASTPTISRNSAGRVAAVNLPRKVESENFERSFMLMPSLESRHH